MTPEDLAHKEAQAKALMNNLYQVLYEANQDGTALDTEFSGLLNGVALYIVQRLQFDRAAVTSYVDDFCRELGIVTDHYIDVQEARHEQTSE